MDDDFEDLLGQPDNDSPGDKKDDDEPDLPDVELDDLISDVPDVDDDDDVIADSEDIADLEFDDEDDEDDDDLGDDLDDDTDDEGADELVGIKSPKIRDRIMREKRRADETVELAETQLTELRNNAAARNTAVHKQRHTEVTNLAQSVVDAAEVVIEVQTAAKKAAREAGDMDAELAADEEVRRWTEIRNGTKPIISKVKEEAAKIEDWEKNFDPKTPVKLEAKTQSDQAGPKIPELALKFVERNQWFEEESNADARGYATGLNTKLVAAGHSEDDPKMYLAIAKQVARKFPKLKVNDLEGKRVAGNQRGSARQRPRGDENVTGRERTATSGNKRANGDVAAEDAKRMRTFGLDPSDKAQRAEWVLNHPKQKQARRSGRRAVI